MAKTARKAAWLLVAMAAFPVATAQAAPDDPLTRRVRTPNAQIAEFIEQAMQSSATFNRIVDQINASDAVVYIDDGRCPHKEAACFIATRMAGSRRMLFVNVHLASHHRDCDVMASIGHELRHTLEVIGDPSVTNTALQYFFYRRIGFHSSAGAFETQTAIDAGNDVRDEAQHFMKAHGR